jgi:hypothetical protein
MTLGTKNGAGADAGTTGNMFTRWSWRRIKIERLCTNNSTRHSYLQKPRACGDHPVDADIQRPESQTSGGGCTWRCQTVNTRGKSRIVFGHHATLFFNNY